MSYDWKNPKRYPSNPKPLPDWMKPKSDGPPWQMSKQYLELALRECYKGVEDYLNENESPYDLTPPPLVPKLFGGNPVGPFDITDQNRPILENLSRLALECYNKKEEGSSASFKFHDLVKCNRWSDRPPCNAFPDRPVDPTEYYITFLATAKGGGDTSSRSPATTTFQAKVLVDEYDKDESPVVEECRIKI